jgi:hypothetical protein
MDITFESVRELREKGLSWRQIGFHFAQFIDEEPYLLQERARKKWRTYHTKRKNASSETSEVAVPLELKEDDVDLEDEASLLRLHGYDPDIWEVIDSSCTIRASSVSTRIKVRPRSTPVIDEMKLEKALSKSIMRISPPSPTATKSIMRGVREMSPSASVAVFALFDVHYGRRSELYSHEDTENTVMEATYGIARHLREDPPEYILLPFGQDFCNSDTPHRTTTKGTPQSTDMEWHEMFAGALTLAIAVIEVLQDIAPVHIVYSRGNHDEVTSYAIVKALAQRYKDTPSVVVREDVMPRQYETYGNTLIGFSHGHDEANLSNIMQSEAREEWGSCEHHYWVTGHLHSLGIDEKGGVTIIRCPSLAFDDDWTARKGFASRKSLALLRFDDTGLKEMYFATP